MGYLFLTGATGLLGSYLLRDLLARGTRLAVLVRPTKFASARHRIETLLEYWEKQVGYSLPRPVVLEGDISKPDLGLDASLMEWVSHNCEAVLHNAASLTFYAESPDGEPWRSNLRGTRHVLEFCRRTGLRQFHHVSTAYVCGLREDRVMESDLDVGQTHGNDYERSKFQAEQLVRAAEYLDKPTVYRPSIILGDSRTGYTTTFHGFYVPLKLVSTTISKTAGTGMPREMMSAGIRMAGQRLREILQLSGDEQKCYVPVDWVSAVMTRIYTEPKHHGRTYHLTPLKPVPVKLTQYVMEETFLKYAEKYTELANEATKTTIDWQEFEKFFFEGMSVYRSYWRDDPTFDCTNTLQVVPDLPCPELDATVIMRMCKYAIESNFGWPRPPVVKPDFDLIERFQKLIQAKASESSSDQGHVLVGLQVNGEGGGQWELKIQRGELLSAETGLSSRSTATFYLNSKTFQRLAKRQCTAEQAIRTGRVLVEGNGVPIDELARVLDDVSVSV